MPLSPVPRLAPGACQERVQVDGCERMLSPPVLLQHAAVCRFACLLSQMLEDTALLPTSATYGVLGSTDSARLLDPGAEAVASCSVLSLT